MTTAEVWTGLWLLDSWAWVVAAGMIGAYGRAVGWRWHRRAGLFLGGVAAIVLAVVSPLSALADGYAFSAHMAQHLVLLLLAPPLLLLGLPGRGLPDSGHGGRRLPDGVALAVQRVVEGALARRWTTWLAGIGAMWFWHIPSLCAASLHDPFVRSVQLVSLVLAGAAFAWPILAPNPARRLEPGPAIAYLVTGCIGCTTLGIWITFSPVEVCPGFFHSADPSGLLQLVRGGWGLDPRLDQQLAGLLMWVPACLCYLGGVLVVLGRGYAPVAVGGVTHAV